MALLALAAGSGHAQNASVPNGSGPTVLLDRVVAVINGDVLLQSDVEEEMRFAALEPFGAGAGKDTRLDAMRRLINRDLILEQMKDQQVSTSKVTDAEVKKSLEDLRSRLPQCAKYDCKTTAGWKAFLAANDLTEQEVDEHWRQRLAILHFIDARFRTGIRIPQASIDDYYAKSVVPVFAREHAAAPPLKEIGARIEEVLLQKQVNGMLQEWLTSLRDEGSVRIVDPQYASLGEPGTQGETAGEE
jgi:hypothetical protein